MTKLEDFSDEELANLTKPSEDEVINNSKPDTLYTIDFGQGKYFQVVSEDKNSTDIKLSSRTMMKVVYIKEKEDISGLELIKIVSNQEKERICFSNFNLAQLRAFLHFIDSLDLKGVSDRRISLSDDSLENFDDATKKKIFTLLSADNTKEIITQLLDEGALTSQDLVNTGYRKQQLSQFKALFTLDGMTQYKERYDIQHDEKAWQHFFYQNQWIFGYGLDYRFMGVLQKEFHASGTNAAGREGVITDYLLGDKRFTTFVEVKLPKTPLFAAGKNRSRVWRLSGDLLDAYSQILEQKASGELKIESEKHLINEHGENITQRSFDSKTILIIGSWSQISADSEHTKITKEKTLELFRRDSRNVEILTYDELYDRAKFIVEHNNNHEN